MPKSNSLPSPTALVRLRILAAEVGVVVPHDECPLATLKLASAKCPPPRTPYGVAVAKEHGLKFLGTERPVIPDSGLSGCAETSRQDMVDVATSPEA